MREFIFDVETMGQNTQTCPVVDCSYFVFDRDRFVSDTPYTMSSLVDYVRKDKLDVQDQVKRLGYKIDPATVEWWAKQGKAAQNAIRPLSTDIKVEDWIQNMITYVAGRKIEYWWTRSNTFDPIILDRIARDSGMTIHTQINNMLKFWTVRDMRTFIDAKTNFDSKRNAFCPLEDESLWNKSFIKHDSRWDVTADILRLQTIARFEAGLELPE